MQKEREREREKGREHAPLMTTKGGKEKEKETEKTSKTCNYLCARTQQVKR